MINLKIVTNRKLCNSLENQIEKILNDYNEKKILKDFKIESIILREKDLSNEEYEALYLKIKKITDSYKINLVINSFIGIAEKNNEEKIHLPYKIFERLVEKNYSYVNKFKSIGVSVHSIEEAKFAKKFGAKYVIYGHIFQTDCKKGLESRGLDNLSKLVNSVDIPVYAIGGIDFENYKYVLEMGVKGICIMSKLMKY